MKCSHCVVAFDTSFGSYCKRTHTSGYTHSVTRVLMMIKGFESYERCYMHITAQHHISVHQSVLAVACIKLTESSEPHWCYS